MYRVYVCTGYMHVQGICMYWGKCMYRVNACTGYMYVQGICMYRVYVCTGWKYRVYV
jgi:hypothetical protein